MNRIFLKILLVSCLFLLTNIGLAFAQTSTICDGVVKSEKNELVKYSAANVTPNFTISKAIQTSYNDTIYLVSVLHIHKFEKQSATGCTIFFKDGSIISFPSETVDIFPISEGKILYQYVITLLPNIFDKFSNSDIYKVELHTFKITVSQTDAEKVRLMANCLKKL
jgi:hypothetical protein